MSADNWDVGTCCICEKDDGTVCNIIFTDHLAPVPGTGWGCIVCRLPGDGAVAVLCDGCFDKIQKGAAQLKYVADGPLAEKKRKRIEQLQQGVKFVHDLYFHPEMVDAAEEFDDPDDDRVAMRYFTICAHCREVIGDVLVRDAFGEMFCSEEHMDLYHYEPDGPKDRSK